MAMTPTYERRNVLTGQAAMYLQTYNPTAAPTMPANSKVLGALWTTPWNPTGATQEGLNFGFSRETSEITVEEQPSPVDIRTSTLAFTASVALSEDTMATMRIAYGGGTITAVAATASAHGYEDLQISDEMEDLSFGFEGENQYGRPRFVVIPVVKSVGEIETTYRRAEEQRLYAITLTSLVPLKDAKIRNITSAPTGP